MGLAAAAQTGPARVRGRRRDHAGGVLQARRAPAEGHRADREARADLYPGERDQCLCKLIVRAGLSGATNYAPVPRAPALDLCPGRLATTDAQEEVAPRAPIQAPVGGVM